MHPVEGGIKRPHGNHLDLLGFKMYTYSY